MDDAFHDAVGSGELDAIETLFRQPDVLNSVRETNDWILSSRATDPATIRLGDGSLPWFRRRKADIDEDDVLLLTAARNGHAYVIEWFFSDDRAAFMGATLLLPLLVQYDGRRGPYLYTRPGDPHVLELLLSSSIFSEYIPHAQHQSILDDAAAHCHSPQVLTIAIAHGAQLTLEVITAIVRHAKTDLAATLDAEGAFLVGADVLAPPFESWEFPHAASFVACGVGWGTRGVGTLLLDAAKRPNDGRIYRLLLRGFVDVDVRDEYDMTPLMHVASFEPSLSGQSDRATKLIVRRLVEHCDLDLVDDMGRTALHYAARNPDIAAMLQDAGADAAIQDHDGWTAHEYWE